MKKKIIALFLSAAMVLSMTGCQKDNDTKNDSGNGSVTQDAETTQAPEQVDIWAPFADTVTIHTVTAQNNLAIYPDGDDITKNVWTRAYKDKFNVELVTDWVTDDYDTKINLSIANGDLPDVFHVNSSQLQQLIDADLVMDITDVFNTYASDRLKGYMAADQGSYESGMRDGKLYGIPQMHYGFISMPNYVWIRQDWKNALNLPDPKTMDDLVNIMQQFMSNYGEYGIAVDQTLDFLNMLAPAWGAHPDIWIEKDGQIQYGSIQPEMKDAVAAWAQWYKDGIINKDFATTDNSKMNQDVVAGLVGVQPFYQWWGWSPGTDVVSNLGDAAQFHPYQIPSANGQQVIASIPFANSSYTVISKKCKNPEAAIKLINYYAYMIDDSAEKESAETITAFTDNDMSHVTGALSVINPESDYQQFEQILAAINSGDASGITNSVNLMKYKNALDYIQNKTPANMGYYLQEGFEGSSYALGKEILDNNWYIQSKLWGAAPQTLLDSGSTLDDILTEGFTKIIIGAEPIDYFDTIIDNWMTAGGEQATNEMNEMYNK